MTTELGNYEMDSVVLALGSDVNILSKKYWELVGKPNLVWSLIQLRLSNQYIIYPTRRLEQVEVNSRGINTKLDFEVIEIMDESNPYPALVGIGWDFNNNAILNLKQQHISFDIDTLCVVVSLDPYEGDKYTELVNEDMESSIIENIYNVTRHKEDYVNPIANGELSWRSVHSHDIDLEDAMDIW
jgi:hypothetical protein